MTTQTRGSSVPQLLERDVETPNGRVFVTEMPGEDPPIVLLHGFPDDHRIYSELLAWLSPRRAVAFDFVGYGRSERKDGAHFSPEDHGAEITAVLDGLDIDRAILVGHDASGPDAVIYALTSPQRVAHVVLMNTVFGNRPSLKMPEMTRLFSMGPAVGCRRRDHPEIDPGSVLRGRPATGRNRIHPSLDRCPA
jgi:haloalkane dehalogenase